MLVIRRRAGENLLVGDDVEVEVLGIEGGQVRLGIRAPRTVVILRKEVAMARAMNQNAARTNLPPGLEGLLGRLRP